MDPRVLTREEILDRAHRLVGTRIGEMDRSIDPALVSSSRTKGVVGLAYERYFGIAANSNPDADFLGAGIELKSAPIVVDGERVRAKERMSLGMIDLTRLAQEDWETASLRKKLDALLIIFYHWSPTLPIAEFTTLAVAEWTPNGDVAAMLERDWTLVRDLAKNNRHGEISESLGRILGAATKGPGGGAARGRRTRAWSLKPPFVASIYIDTVGARPYASLIQNLSPARPLEYEDATLRLLRRYQGRVVGDVAREVGIVNVGGKNVGATVVRRILGLPARGPFREEQWLGLEVKTVPFDPQGRAYEEMSFPAFKHMELVEQDWEDSDLLARLTRLLVVPLIRPRREDLLTDATIGKAFFWVPSREQLIGIRREWEDFRDRIARGEADRLPTKADTRHIHVRPKARVASDMEPAPGGLMVTKKCFWLNREVIQEAARDAGAVPAY